MDRFPHGPKKSFKPSPSSAKHKSQHKRLSKGMDVSPQERSDESTVDAKESTVAKGSSIGNNGSTGGNRSTVGNGSTVDSTSTVSNGSPLPKRDIHSHNIAGLVHHDEESMPPDAIQVKIICLGDSAVGKSKLMERFLQDSYKPKQLSTFALTIFTHKTQINFRPVYIDFWDTAGQERFSSLHPSYYHQAHACIMVFDATRKVTYKNLSIWYNELREYRPEIPCLLAVNKIDADMEVTKRSFAFAEKNNIPLYYVSASDGTNVVKLFKEAIAKAVEYKQNPTDWKDQLMVELETIKLKREKENAAGQGEKSSS